jgi:hypothetical protein
MINHLKIRRSPTTLGGKGKKGVSASHNSVALMDFCSLDSD